jgi:hypothetical protein
MSAGVQYYAIIDYKATREEPAGLVRRRTDDDGSFSDEALHRDSKWRFTPVIVEWKRGKSTDGLIEISAQEAEQIIERFQSRWGSAG